MSADPTIQSLSQHSASSLRPLALQAMQKVDESSAVRDWKHRRDSTLSHDFSDSSSTTPGSAQSCYTESDAASTAPSSPRTPRRRSELAELNFYALPLETAHHKSSPPSTQMHSSPGLSGLLQPASSEQPSSSLPGPAQLLSSARQTPCSSLNLEVQHDRRKSSTDVSVADSDTRGSALDQFTDPIAAEALSRLSISCTLHQKPRHRVYNRGLFSRRIYALSSIEHHPTRFIKKEICNNHPSEYGRCHVLQHTIGGHVKKERHPPLPPPHGGDGCGGRVKQKNQGHCNKPYPWEQTCWIRYQFEDLKKPWTVVEELFDQTFQDPNLERTRQGLQGSFYRQNKMLPHLDQESERYIGMPNGHIALEVVKKREQKHRREGFFNFVNLYPEWAVQFDWVSEEHKQDANRLLDQRLRDQERIKQEAIDAGLWVEELGKDECSCCAPKKWLPKEDVHQRAQSTTPTRRQSF
ncbi:hypothetical protein PG993_000672 [Apiospora rasikravindrae]|uniref:Uncharacterized protein n=1 Tax=Apiospora rasikravindrae TaxID=990691 RepID=A0ABR1UBI4_9PEZI